MKCNTRTVPGHSSAHRTGQARPCHACNKEGQLQPATYLHPPIHPTTACRYPDRCCTKDASTGIDYLLHTISLTVDQARWSSAFDLIRPRPLRLDMHMHKHSDSCGLELMVKTDCLGLQLSQTDKTVPQASQCSTITEPMERKTSKHCWRSSSSSRCNRQAPYC